MAIEKSKAIFLLNNSLLSFLYSHKNNVIWKNKLYLFPIVMKIHQENIVEQSEIKHFEKFSPDFILCFSTLNAEKAKPFLELLKKQNPNTKIIGCSSQKNIYDVNIIDRVLTLTYIAFETSNIQLNFMAFDCQASSYKNGLKYAQNQENKNLNHLILFTTSPINGSSFLQGLQDEISSKVKLTGGIASIPNVSEATYVIYDGKTYCNAVVSINIYGKETQVGFGSEGGWDSFGIERQVTKSNRNIVYELDGQNVLDLYKSYLGDLVYQLPDVAVLFPFSLRTSEHHKPIVRSVLEIDEENKSLIFGGNIPQNSFVKLMKANVDRLISGAETSAKSALHTTTSSPSLALLVSCRGRLPVLKQLAEEEIEIVKETLGSQVYITGFYSNGEFAPSNDKENSVLHNQTMTITTFSE